MELWPTNRGVDRRANNPRRWQGATNLRRAMERSTKITVMEREQLSRAIRMREKVAKSELDARAAQALGDFEAHIQAQYHYSEDVVWKAAMEQAQPVIDNARRMIADRAKELGIPARFAPSLS